MEQENGVPEGVVLSPLLFNISQMMNHSHKTRSPSFTETTQQPLFREKSNEQCDKELSTALAVLGNYYGNNLKHTPQKRNRMFHLGHKKSCEIKRNPQPKCLGGKLDRTPSVRAKTSALNLQTETTSCICLLTAPCMPIP